MTTDILPLGSLEPPPPPRFHLLRFLGRLVLTLCGCFFLLILLLAFINPRGYRSRTYGQLTACKSNCKNIATALEMYSSDHKGRYPQKLEQLLEGNYLKVIPTCPTARRMTYENYQVSSQPDAFSFACCGLNHSKANLGANLPRYYSETGLIDHD
ncbi:MAG: hypothetical protein KF760_23690 [Candidatus Eremiobacteraeota bacterium]|nr:hypothetical protein [Candidatus Eremiobacteraeota bacterium]MCW5866228.1 hypothetical protein [Candidatus Eremiobacteraeota bacterium]